MKRIIAIVALSITALFLGACATTNHGGCCGGGAKIAVLLPVVEAAAVETTSDQFSKKGSSHRESLFLCPVKEISGGVVKVLSSFDRLRRKADRESGPLKLKPYSTI